MTSEMKDLRYVRIDWKARAEAAEAELALYRMATEPVDKWRTGDSR